MTSQSNYELMSRMLDAGATKADLLRIVTPEMQVEAVKRSAWEFASQRAHYEGCYRSIGDRSCYRPPKADHYWAFLVPPDLTVQLKELSNSMIDRSTITLAMPADLDYTDPFVREGHIRVPAPVTKHYSRHGVLYGTPIYLERP